jgi:hypothetical protein
MNHIVISGTGRAGTSFLVRYLHENGIETHLSKSPGEKLDPFAHAGLEDMPLRANAQDLPYVIKSPWLGYDPEALLGPDVIGIDALILPVRSLEEAAASRVTIERAAMHRSAPWMLDLPRSFDVWGHVPGGMVFSLDRKDQERLLAVSFHRLVQFAVHRDIPLIILDFPRLVTDADYLWRKLEKVIPLERTRSIEVHARISDLSLVHDSKQDFLLEHADSERSEQLDRAAISREVHHMRQQIAALEHSEHALKSELETLMAVKPASLPNMQPEKFTLMHAIRMWLQSRAIG